MNDGPASSRYAESPPRGRAGISALDQKTTMRGDVRHRGVIITTILTSSLLAGVLAGAIVGDEGVEAPTAGPELQSGSARPATPSPGGSPVFAIPSPGSRSNITYVVRFDGSIVAIEASPSP